MDFKLIIHRAGQIIGSITDTWSHFLSHFLLPITPIAHCLFVPQIQRAMPTHKAKKRFTPTTSTVPLAPKNSTPKAIDT